IDYDQRRPARCDPHVRAAYLRLRLLLSAAADGLCLGAGVDSVHDYFCVHCHHRRYIKSLGVLQQLGGMMAAATTYEQETNYLRDRFLPIASGVVGQVLLYLLLIASSLWFIAPLVWMFLTSFMPLEQVGVFPPELIPRQWQFVNYTEA